MNISFTGIGEVYATFACTEDIVKSGVPVMLSGSGAVSPCTNGGTLCGFAGPSRGGLCRVQVSGFAEVSYSGTAPEVGFSPLVGNGTGGVMVSEKGRSCMVVSVDRLHKTAVVML